MKIGVDIRYLSYGHLGGVSTVVRAIATELPRIGHRHEFVFYADNRAPLELADLPGNVRIHTLPWRHGLSSFINDTKIGRLAEADSLDVFHGPANVVPLSRVPAVVFAHDVRHVTQHAEQLRGFGTHPGQTATMLYLRRQARASLQRARHIITPSEHLRHDIARRSGVPLDRVTTAHLAASDQFCVIPRRELTSTTERHGLVGRYVIADGIKNPGAVITAYRALPETLRHSLQIVFFSRETAPRPEVAEAIQHFGTARIRFITKPPTQDLVHLMSGATALLFPSRFEGFSISLVEAMRCGVPIVASSCGSIPEVLGNAGLTSDIDVPGSFTREVTRLLTDDQLRLTLARRGLARGRTFSWHVTATNVLSVLERNGTVSRHIP